MKINLKLICSGWTKTNYLFFILFFILLTPLLGNAADYNPDLLSRQDFTFSIVTGVGPGGSPHIRAFAESGNVEFYPDKLFAYGEDSRQGVYVTTGDIDADSLDEIITAPRVGGGPQVRVFEKDGTQRGIEIWPFHPDTRTGINVAAGDVDSDGKDEIAVSQSADGQAWVKVYKYNNEKEVLGEWNAFGEATCGASIAMSDVDADGNDEVIVAAGEGCGPQVKIYKADGTFMRQFFAFEEEYHGGLDVAAGDLNGDGFRKDIVISKKKEAAEIKVFRLGDEIETLANFRAFDNFTVGAFVDAFDMDEDDIDEILVGAGEGGGPQVELYEHNGDKINTTFFAYDEGARGGVDVTGGLFSIKDGIPYTFAGAGDIAGCTYDEDEETAKLLDNIKGTVFTAGDCVYPNGTNDEFANCYDPTWGRHKLRTKPSVGNHEYRTTNASGYFNYFGSVAGEIDKGYYSYDLGPWHMVVLNTNCSKIDGCEEGSNQERWLKQDLAQNSSICTLSYMHHPYYSSGPHGNTTEIKPLVQDLYDYNADLMVAGHDHTYERFQPQNVDRNLDLRNGLTQFVVGTGGKDLYSFPDIQENSVVRYNDSHGIIKFTLYSNSYEWEYIPIAGYDFSDKGYGWCH